MGRLQLVELEDQPWFPQRLRDYVTDLLNFQISLFGFYDPIVDLLHHALVATGEHRLVDLCSGGGGPVRRMQRQLRDRHGYAVSALLTDRYPNRDAFERAAAGSDGSVRSLERSVDATAVPPDLDGFRTLFTALHHFRPDAARENYVDAARHGRGIAAFEMTERSALGLSSMLFSPLVTLATTPLMRPLRVDRLALTYLLPVVPLAYLFDGVVSQLRTYSPDELRRLVDGVGGGGYLWEIGKVRHPWLPARVTYVVGRPRGDRRE